MKYVIESRYVASMINEVEANDEGEALEKARVLSEEEPISSFVIKEELESNIINQYD